MFRRSISWSVSLIVLTVLAIVMTGNATMFAQEAEPTARSKETANPVDQILFGSQDKNNSDFYKGKGWHANEEKLNWTSEKAELYIPLDPAKDAILDFQLVYPHGQDYVNIIINGYDLGYWNEGITGNGEWKYHKKMLLPKQVLAKGILNKLVLTIPVPIITESRTLGIPVMGITIKYVNTDIEFQGSESRAVNFFVDLNEERKAGKYRYHNLSGWVYVNDQETRGQEVYVKLEKPDGTVVYYLTMPNERPDVGAGFNNPLYNHSGFSASIPLEDGLDFDACTIRLVVKNRNGIYKSPAWKEWIRAGSPAGKVSVFVAVNWLLVITTFIVLFLAIWRDRSLLIKPSIMAILFFHVMCQWGTALEAGRIETFLAKPWIFVLLSHGFPMIGLAVSLLICRRPARQLWGRMTADMPIDLIRKTWAWVILAVCFAGFIVVYLSHVPFRSTGLYTIFTSPSESGLARDQSVKFLANPFLRYGYTIVMAVFAPLLAVLTVQLLLVQVRRRKWLLAILYLIFLVCVFVASSLSGARAYSAFIILAVAFALLMRKGFPVNPLFLAAGILLILTFPTLLTLWREGKSVTAKNFYKYFSTYTYQRVVIIPVGSGLWHVQYAQTHGFFGIQAIPKLAALKGIKPLNVPNFITKIQSGDVGTTSTANTAYIYAYYSYFGLIVFIPCLIGLWLLDLSLLVYRKLSANLLIPCVACISIAANTFSQTEYTISLFSQGFLFLLLVSWAVDRVVPKIELAIKKK